MTDQPNFAAWEYATLAKFASDLYTQNQQMHEALEQVRQDLKDAMELLRNKRVRDL